MNEHEGDQNIKNGAKIKWAFDKVKAIAWICDFDEVLKAAELIGVWQQVWEADWLYWIVSENNVKPTVNKVNMTDIMILMIYTVGVLSEKQETKDFS